MDFPWAQPIEQTGWGPGPLGTWVVPLGNLGLVSDSVHGTCAHKDEAAYPHLSGDI